MRGRNLRPMTSPGESGRVVHISKPLFFLVLAEKCVLVPFTMIQGGLRRFVLRSLSQHQHSDRRGKLKIHVTSVKMPSKYIQNSHPVLCQKWKSSGLEQSLRLSSDKRPFQSSPKAAWS